MENICEYHLKGKTALKKVMGIEYLSCNRKICPYHNQRELKEVINYEGEEKDLFCTSQGLKKKLEETEKVSK